LFYFVKIKKKARVAVVLKREMHVNRWMQVIFFYKDASYILFYVIVVTGRNESDQTT
jgi:hypothetical protein